MSFAKIYIGLNDTHAYVRIEGRAVFNTSTSFDRCVTTLLENGTEYLSLEMEQCSAMDSSFMGTLTKFALQFMGKDKKITILNLSKQGHKLLSEIGVHQLFEFVESEPPIVAWALVFPTENTKADVQTDGQVMLKAHEVLMEVDKDNIARFEHVVASLREDLKKIEEKS
ncbi:MAG: STAS domain-containing protein [Lentisphaeria bacterium]|nr:STAS domain-containing protein [Lentisphaeria bacterium]